MAEHPALAVVIPTLNEAGHVGRLLEDLAAQRGTVFKVVVSDSGSTDQTESVAKLFAGKLDLKFIHGKTLGPAAARNSGATQAHGKWLLFLDADVRLPDAHFLQKLVDGAEERGWLSASALVATDSPKLSDKMGTRLSQSYTSLLAHTRHPVALGSCILTDRQLFKEIGGFDKSLAVAEDYDYVSRAGAKAGFGFVKSTAYIYNLRRFQQEGPLKVFLRSVGYEIYRFTHHYQIRHDPFNYRFGHHRQG